MQNFTKNYFVNNSPCNLFKNSETCNMTYIDLQYDLVLLFKSQYKDDRG